MIGTIEFLSGVIGILMIAFIFFGGLWKIFSKAGRPGWGAFVPVYNIYLMVSISGLPTWFLTFFFIPILPVMFLFFPLETQIVILSKAQTIFPILKILPFAFVLLAGYMWIKLVSKYEKGVLFGFGCVFLPIIFIPILGFGKSKYTGNISASKPSDKKKGERFFEKIMAVPKTLLVSYLCAIGIIVCQYFVFRYSYDTGGLVKFLLIQKYLLIEIVILFAIPIQITINIERVYILYKMWIHIDSYSIVSSFAESSVFSDDSTFLFLKICYYSILFLRLGMFLSLLFFDTKSYRHNIFRFLLERR